MNTISHEKKTRFNRVEVISDFQNQAKLQQCAQKSPFCNELERFLWETIFIDQCQIETTNDLKILCFNEHHYSIWKQNVEASDHLKTIGNLTGIKFRSNSTYSLR